MWNNRYYTLKDMVVALVTLLIVSSIALCSWCFVSEQNKQLQERIKTLELQLSAYEFVPDWLMMSYDKCNCPEVPEDFLRECVAYEIKSKN